MATRGSYVHNSMVEMLGLCTFLRKLMVSLELIQLYKQNPLEKFLIFTFYQHYTLALSIILSFTSKSQMINRHLLPPPPNSPQFPPPPFSLTRSIRDSDTSIDFVQGPPGSRREWVKFTF